MQNNFKWCSPVTQHVLINQLTSKKLWLRQQLVSHLLYTVCNMCIYLFAVILDWLHFNIAFFFQYLCLHLQANNFSFLGDHGTHMSLGTTHWEELIQGNVSFYFQHLKIVILWMFIKSWRAIVLLIVGYYFTCYRFVTEILQ